MAEYCEPYDLFVTHVPKTGGVFVEQVLINELKGQRVGGRHDTLRRINPDPLPTVRAFVVREPIGWYRSYWSFAMQTVKTPAAWPIWGKQRGGHPTSRLDSSCGSGTFETFVANVLREFPNGFVRSMYCDFLNGCTHALRTSHLRLDLEQLLSLVEFEHPEIVRELPAANESAVQLKSKAVLSEATERRLREVDNLAGLRFPYI